MEIQHEFDGHKGRFFVADTQGRTLAESTYSFAPPARMIIDHTEVDESLKGTGTGTRLVESAVAYARAHGYQILPLCPFAKALIDKRPDLQDVLTTR